MNKIGLTMVALALAGCASEGSNTDTRAAGSAPYVVDNGYYGSSRCMDCGTIETVEARQISGKPNVGGAIVGAIIGGVAGHQFGSGRGKDAATAGGAIAGGAIGSQVNKGESSTVYDLGVRMDGGDYRTVTVAATGGLRSGSRVRISGDRVSPL
ncbi:MAG TPA: glycine zipper 2TM domain-containing protein [Solimonas sp.]|nr:glycine zipper 2TM domain-containing protein [Solimonas sp.]